MMGSIRDDQKQNMSQFMSAFWNELVKPYYNPEASDEWWGTVIDTANRLGTTYHCEENKRILFILESYIRGLEAEAKSEGLLTNNGEVIGGD